MNEPVAYIKLSKTMLPILVWNPEISVKYSSYVVINEDIPLYTQQRPHNTVLGLCDKLAEMHAEIEALKEQIKEKDVCLKILMQRLDDGN